MQAATEKVAGFSALPYTENRLLEANGREAPATGSGTSSFLADLYVKHHDLIFKTAFRITGSAMDAEDILHTVFLRLLRKAPGEMGMVSGSGAMQQPGLTRAYLHRAAVNAALDVLRRRHRTVELEPLEPVLQDDGPGLEDRQHSAELGDWLRSALARLNPKAAEIFTLRFVEGYSNIEISRMLGTSQSVVAVILFRIRGRLKREIESFLGGTP